MTTGDAFDPIGMLQQLEDHSLRVGVLGLGSVGLSLALSFAERAGLSVTGFDTDIERVTQLNTAPQNSRFIATNDFSQLSAQDVLIIAVPTPLNDRREPDLSDVERAAKTIVGCLKPGKLVVLSTTSYPGTTEEFLLPILESTGLKSGVDFLLAYCPEREDPGNRLVGGVGSLATEVATALFAKVVKTVVPVPSARIAEAAKLTENVFVAVNIALVNELKVAYGKMGLDIWEVLDAAETTPFGFMRFNPGPGHRRASGATRLIELASEINHEMPQHVLAKLLEALSERGIAMEDCRVLVLGLAYKKDSDDSRESPALTLIELLLQHRATVSYHDPYIPVMPAVPQSWEQFAPRSVPLTEEVVSAHDATVIVTDHSSIDYGIVQANAPLVIDTRRVYRRNYPNVLKA